MRRRTQLLARPDFRLALSLGLLLAASPAAPAQIAVAGYVLDDAALPDVTTPLAGSQPGFASPSSGCLAASTLPGLTLQQSMDAILTDDGVDGWVFGKTRVQLDFVDNVVVNGPGADLLVLEIGGAESFSLQVFADSIGEFGNAITLSVAPTGFTVDPCGLGANSINAAEVDLDDFGVLPGASVRRVLLNNLGQAGGSVGADIALVAALHSGPPAGAAPASLLTFQQGLDGGFGVYAGAVDTAIAADLPGNNFAAAPLEYVDASPEHSLLLRFDGLVGAGAGQVPPGATIQKATLTISSGPGSGDGSAGTHAVHRLLQPWNVATLTFASGFGGDGIDANGVEATSAPVATIPAMGANATLDLDVTAAVQAWADGAPNFGLALITASADALGVQLAEASVATLRPALQVQVLGQLRFAEAVASFDPVISGGGPSACSLTPNEALGAPDYIDFGSVCCAPIPTTVTLGAGGALALEFTSASISGGGSPEPDLWIYERGPDVEDTYVELSVDGSSWVPAGKVFGSVSAVDLDALGFGPLDLFRYIRLTDDPLEGEVTGCAVGADIDAVAALSPNPWVNLGASLAGSNGPPKLAASGKLVAGSLLQFAITQALPNGSATLVLGTSVLGAPFKGGTMVPSVVLLVPGLPLGPSGSLTLPALWPAGLPAGLPIVLQAWIKDAGGPKGFAATNGIKALTE